MKVDVLLGLQWGDEGKGKIVDVLAPRYDIIARFQGGPNAGHTIKAGDRKFILHTIPSGILFPETTNLIGNGVIIDPLIMLKEINELRAVGIDATSRLLVSRKAHLILPTHRLLDAVQEISRGAGKIGSTLKGIGPTYTDKIARQGLRIGEYHEPGFIPTYQEHRDAHLKMVEQYGIDFSEMKFDGLDFDSYERNWMEALKTICELEQVDSEYFIHHSLWNRRSVLAEGAQGTLLDIDFGSYPFVTSSNTITAGVCTGLGLAPSNIGRVFGIVKAYCTRVGSGPFPTELLNATGELLRKTGHEYGSTTGRPRRCGWLDLVALKYSVMMNGVTHIFLTKADVLSAIGNIGVCTAYQRNGEVFDTIPFNQEGLNPKLITRHGWNKDITHASCMNELPDELHDYIRMIEHETGVPVAIVSVGPDRDQTIFTREF